MAAPGWMSFPWLTLVSHFRRETSNRSPQGKFGPPRTHPAPTRRPGAVGCADLWSLSCCYRWSSSSSCFGATDSSAPAIAFCSSARNSQTGGLGSTSGDPSDVRRGFPAGQCSSCCPPCWLSFRCGDSRVWCCCLIDQGE